MSRFGDAWKALTRREIIPTPPVMNGFPAGDFRSTILHNTNIIAPANNKQGLLNKGFNQNDIVFSLTQLIAEKIKVAPWDVYQVKDEKALKGLRIMEAKGEGSTKEAILLRKKAIELYDGDSTLTQLLKEPNEADSFQDLVANSSVNKLLLGSRAIAGRRLDAGANQGKPYSLEMLPSQGIMLAVSKTWPFKVLAYFIPEWGTDFILRPEEVLWDAYYNPNFDITGQHLNGHAPLSSAQGLIDRSNSENMAAATAFHNGGPKTIIYVDYVPGMEFGIIEAQIKAVKEKLSGAEYSGASNANKAAYSGYKMGVEPVGLSPVDLGIMESEKATLRRLCNVIGGVPSQLLNDPDNKIYSNVTEGEKALTTRSAMPLMNAFRDKFNKKLGKDWGFKGKNIYIDYDISVYPELQEDLAHKWTYIKEMPITNRQKLDAMEFEVPEGHDEFMDKILVPSNYATSDDFEQSATDTALAEGDGDIPV